MVKDYYALTKSGLVFGNLVTVIGGFALASQGQGIAVGKLLATLAGMALVMASGGVFNNYIDRDIDRLMKRTDDRALLKGKISGSAAFVFGTILGVGGIVILSLFTNFLTVFLAIVGFFLYVFVYSMVFKRISTYGTFVGALSGAIPPVVGYCAVTDRFDIAAIVLFLILITWQMAHFFSIAIRRVDDYAAAKIPVLPVKHGIQRTKISMAIYIIEFVVAASLLAIFGYLGISYFVIALILGTIWLGLSIRGFWIKKAAAEHRWAIHMFSFSLVVMVVLFATITLESVFMK
jgi:protoheme IX farnesyltransferase